MDHSPPAPVCRPQQIPRLLSGQISPDQRRDGQIRRGADGAGGGPSQPNRQRIAAICRERNIALASHDDATCEHVLESRQLGSVIAEFPTTIAAAQASRQHGMNILMGAPNIVRGGSHSGTSPPTIWRPAACWTFSPPTIIPPACWMPLFASPTTRATPLPSRRPFVW